MSKPDSITQQLYQALRRGRELCASEALSAMAEFVAGQQHGDGGFVNRAGAADGYYGMFGLLLASVLDARIDLGRLETALARQDPRALDLVHLLCLLRSRLLLAFLRVAPGLRGVAALLPLARALPKDWRDAARDLLATGDPGRFPNHDAQSPYSQFLALSLAQDAGQPWAAADLRPYQLASGLFSNERGGATASVNATSAALVLARYGHGGVAIAASALDAFAAMQRPDGSFPAVAAAPAGDLLSTATACFALSLYDRRPLHSPRAFLYDAFTASGGFSAGPGDDVADLEYTTYGLLTMGVL
ncbi:MAG: hypothetical protein PHT80_10890 [Lentisphaeria bacterium]|nr:hypothetical protein [Lentisphaeria bacterium]